MKLLAQSIVSRKAIAIVTATLLSFVTVFSAPAPAQGSTWIPYNRSGAAAYAQKWAKARNSKYADYSYVGAGGDCTNFVSQAIYEGGGIPMDPLGSHVWFYYRDGAPGSSTRSPTWAGVKEFYSYIQSNSRFSGQNGPIGQFVTLDQLELGDLVFLMNTTTAQVNHAMMVTKIEWTGIWPWRTRVVKVSYHTNDTLDKSLSEINPPSTTKVYYKILGYNKP